ncbi:hypothetical protein ACF0H5_018890 [Mactra antiquata]
MSRVRFLKGTPFSIDYDFPKEIQEARARIWPKLKDLRREYPRSRVQIVYPAKLLHDGRVVCDELPEWNRYVNANRLETLTDISVIKSPKYAHKYSNVASRSEHSDAVFDTTSMEYESSQPPISQPTEREPEFESTPANLVSSDSTNLSVKSSAQPTANDNSCEETSVVSASVSEAVFLKPNSVIKSSAKVNIGSNPNSEETSVKSLLSDATNPTIHPMTDSGPIRGRSHASRSAARSNKRSNSATPYRRKSVSKTRDDSPRVLPVSKNSTVSKQSVESGFSPNEQPINSDSNTTTPID